MAQPSFQDILDQYDYYLQEFSYIKIWDEMSARDRELARSIAKGNCDAAAIEQDTGMNSKTYSVYRVRLKKKGLVDGSVYGRVTFSLPRFAEFVLSQPL